MFGQFLSRGGGQEAKNLPRNGDEEIDPFVVVQRLDVERLDVSRSFRHGFSSDYGSSQSCS